MLGFHNKGPENCQIYGWSSTCVGITQNLEWKYWIFLKGGEGGDLIWEPGYWANLGSGSLSKQLLNPKSPTSLFRRSISPTGKGRCNLLDFVELMIICWVWVGPEMIYSGFSPIQTMIESSLEVLADLKRPPFSLFNVIVWFFRASTLPGFKTFLLQISICTR